MREYDFKLVFDLALVRLRIDECVEALGAGGCDDAIVGVGKPGRISLQFVREAESANAAVLGAIRDVQTALPGASLLEAAPDYVGVTEVAVIVGCSRQNLRKLLLLGAAATVPVPSPVHEGTSAIWHLALLLRWLRDEKRYRIADDLIELASIAMQVNVALDRRLAAAPECDAIAALLA